MFLENEIKHEPTVEAFRDDQEQDHSWSKKIDESIDGLSTTSNGNDAQVPVPNSSDSSKLSTLITNSFLTNQLLIEVLNILQAIVSNQVTANVTTSSLSPLPSSSSLSGGPSAPSQPAIVLPNTVQGGKNIEVDLTSRELLCIAGMSKKQGAVLLQCYETPFQLSGAKNEKCLWIKEEVCLGSQVCEKNQDQSLHCLWRV
ncbi:hypothetical protein OS493_017531 [Desmophyllum pertusum]|uniref:Uncharacterized protein n=1 Tax=Desmophyllum pertusum TaxID=174260 RepID=A0A9X0D354_9CNID|nr:hypothetical protein OS493_017531 [Desmophyllum pertusum]